MKAKIKFDDKELVAHLNKSTIVDELYVIFTKEDTPQYSRIKLEIHPKKDIVLQSIDIEYPIRLDKNSDKVYCNGFQTMSESRLFSFSETPDSLLWFVKPFLAHYGDDNLSFIPRRKGVLHSWSWGYIDRSNIRNIDFIGSLSESTGFTYLLYNADNQIVTIKKELNNLHLSHSFPAMDILVMSGKLSETFNTYYSLQNTAKPQIMPHNIWSSATLPSEKMSEQSIHQSLELLKNQGTNPDFILIDEGWQYQVGDWLTTKNTFPGGMNVMAQAIHQRGYKAGLWLAPFIVQQKSFIAQNKTEWLLRDTNNQLVKVGFAPQWSGWTTPFLYCLDFYNKDVQNYLTGVFHTIFTKWGFDMVQLDYLYAVCAKPRPNKTRGQIMHDAMVFLKQQAGNKVIIASRVPIASTSGLAQFYRQNPKNHLPISPKWLKFLGFREITNNE